MEKFIIECADTSAGDGVIMVTCFGFLTLAYYLFNLYFNTKCRIEILIAALVIIIIPSIYAILNKRSENVMKKFMKQVWKEYQKDITVIE